MASTRNKNTPGNYQLEQLAFNKQVDYSTYINAAQGIPLQTNYPGDGLCGASIPYTELSKNAVDIHSYLLGINSTNLVSPEPKLEPQLTPIKTLSIINRIPVFIPPPLIVEPNQRQIKY